MAGRLSSTQVEAIAHVKQAASALRDQAKATLADALQRAHLGEALLTKATRHIQTNAQVVLHFHPDRLMVNGQSVADALLHTGVYRNQFETGISNGGLTAFPGGDRDEWEKRLFGGAYQQAHVTAAERPKYGALDLMNYADGAAPRFGSCYFRLRQAVSQWCSFTNKDSVYAPEVFGTIDELTGIIAALVAEVETNGETLGAKGLTVADLLTRFATIANPPVRCATNYGRTLDDYVEAQVHGPVVLGVDVERLVADPSFQGTETGETLALLCARYAIELDWHGGFQLHPSAVPSEFRGPQIPLLARRIAGDRLLSAALIGEAAVALVRQPERWQDWGTPAETRQQLKQLWHVLAYYGQPVGSEAAKNPNDKK